MVEGGGAGARSVERDEGRESARIGNFAGACQSLPALRLGSLGGRTAEEAGARGCHDRALYPRQEPCALVAPARVCAGGSGQQIGRASCRERVKISMVAEPL